MTDHTTESLTEFSTTTAPEAAEGNLEHRAIRSFVLRQGRLSNAQSRFLDDMMPKIGVTYRPERLDLPGLFGRKAPVIFEIGFGMGETTASIAAAHPENDYLGVE
ncbi:MAG TPA: tRNA (guanosine(46)-N7)-methyltransferase TrmB, partial [Azospira sp.]|nr:tRNA (guanosine(46)-N7)-methyltransferase TrmB [Azospira sp.]